MKWGSSTVFQVERKRGPVWYAKYRTPTGRQVQKLIGPVWSGRGSAPAGTYTKRPAGLCGPQRRPRNTESLRESFLGELVTGM